MGTQGLEVIKKIHAQSAKHGRTWYDLGCYSVDKSCHKNRMPTRLTTFLRPHETSLITSVSAIRFLIENVHFESVNIPFQRCI